MLPMPATFHAQPHRTSGLSHANRLARMRRIAWVVDAAFHIPGTGFRFGLNSVIGLAPGVGDAVLGLISLYLVQQAHAMGVPNAKLARMLGNIVLEVAGGSVPILGDLFDMALKANLRNIRIVEEHLGPSGWR
jgi:hypothetical protein